MKKDFPEWSLAATSAIASIVSIHVHNRGDLTSESFNLKAIYVHRSGLARSRELPFAFKDWWHPVMRSFEATVWYKQIDFQTYEGTFGESTCKDVNNKGDILLIHVL